MTNSHVSVNAGMPVATDLVHVPPLFPPEFERRVGGVDLLGSPLGSTEYAESYVGTRVNNIGKVLEVLSDMDHPQVELAMLRSCLGFPKFNFALRTCPPSKLKKAILV